MRSDQTGKCKGLGVGKKDLSLRDRGRRGQAASPPLTSLLGPVDMPRNGRRIER